MQTWRRAAVGWGVALIAEVLVVASAMALAGPSASPYEGDFWAALSAVLRAGAWPGVVGTVAVLGGLWVVTTGAGSGRPYRGVPIVYVPAVAAVGALLWPASYMPYGGAWVILCLAFAVPAAAAWAAAGRMRRGGAVAVGVGLAGLSWLVVPFVEALYVPPYFTDRDFTGSWIEPSVGDGVFLVVRPDGTYTVRRGDCRERGTWRTADGPDERLTLRMRRGGGAGVAGAAGCVPGAGPVLRTGGHYSSPTVRFTSGDGAGAGAQGSRAELVVYRD
ncbi:hypothetical protein J7E96_06900 [Streptomyces sp. ISL-96]|uniref:hypothetical protein n=1 Tax=Streptomyces sp. ISL-96 TaxID=2819191 RepID=UPI001BE51B44|nr:hypothetical protein [Streptomyces sp. ISL-96]MBT2488254.1 hypothetical protein [Streptomyces sp. ISL-96]